MKVLGSIVVLAFVIFGTVYFSVGAVIQEIAARVATITIGG